MTQKTLPGPGGPTGYDEMYTYAKLRICRYILDRKVIIPTRTPRTRVIRRAAEIMLSLSNNRKRVDLP